MHDGKTCRRLEQHKCTARRTTPEIRRKYAGNTQSTGNWLCQRMASAWPRRWHTRDAHGWADLEETDPPKPGVNQVETRWKPGVNQV